MKRFACGILLVIVLALFYVPASNAAAHIQFIDMGTPKNVSLVMTGWHGVVVRVSLDGGAPITRISFGDQSFGGHIGGNIAQRWTDPTGQGNYTQTSPGPLTANNTFDSDFNFDTHFLGAPGMYTTSLLQEGVTHGFFTTRTGLVSDGFVGYGADQFVNPHPDPIVLGNVGLLRGVLDVNPGFQSSSIDAAYVVTDGAFLAFVVVSGASNESTGAIFEVPEPGGIGLAGAVAIAGLIRRRTRQPVARLHTAVVEALESRVQLTVPTPTRRRRPPRAGNRARRRGPATLRIKETACLRK